MHKSYKYILIALTTVFIFFTIFSVQKASANSDLQKTYPKYYEYINSEKFKTLQKEYPYIIVQNLEDGENRYLYIYMSATKLKVDTGDNYYKFSDNLSIQVIRYNKTYNTITENTTNSSGVHISPIIYTNYLLEHVTDSKYNISPFGNIDPFYQPPFQMELKEIPIILMMGAMKILPVGLVILSLLLGIALIPRLINYFRQ